MPARRFQAALSDIQPMPDSKKKTPEKTLKDTGEVKTVVLLEHINSFQISNKMLSFNFKSIKFLNR